MAADYGVARIEDGKALDDAALVAKVTGMFRKLVGEEIWSQHGGRFLFAIAVDSIECWLLALVFDESQKAKRAKTSGCLEALDHQLRKAGEKPLSSQGSKDPEVYRALWPQAAGGDRAVVIKRLLPALLGDPEQRAMFDHEAELGRRPEGPVLVAEPPEGPAPPQAEGGSQRADAIGTVEVGRLRDEGPEPLDIQFVVAEDERVALPLAPQPVAHDLPQS